VALGIWVLISPFVLGHSQSNAFLWNNIVLGIVIGVLAWYAAAEATSEERAVG